MRVPDDLPIRVISHNIRYATGSPFKGEDYWVKRCPRLLNELRFNTAHCETSFICLQEVLHKQLVDILSGLNRNSSTDKQESDEWAYIGVGRDDGKQAGEYSPIIYRPAVWALLEHWYVWLSPTPKKPSKGWDAASIRILTVAKLRHQVTRKKVLVMCTHLDDQGSESRYEAARIINAVARDISEADSDENPLPVVLAGDFNSEPKQEAYKFITEEGSFADSFHKIPMSEHYGSEKTFTGFKKDVGKTRIDYIFTREKDGKSPWQVKHYATLETQFDDGIFISDHRPVVADLILS